MIQDVYQERLKAIDKQAGELSRERRELKERLRVLEFEAEEKEFERCREQASRALELERHTVLALAGQYLFKSVEERRTYEHSHQDLVEMVRIVRFAMAQGVSVSVFVPGILHAGKLRTGYSHVMLESVCLSRGEFDKLVEWIGLGEKETA